ncbi:MAG: WD40 repeat domain-containing serine/threonine-protein kinase [Gemmatales bacterium]
MAETTVAWNVDSNLIDEVIYQFEKAFKEGKNPNPDDCLKGEGLTRWRLLMELLHSDLELRLRAGQSVKVADYLARYPELAKFPNEVIVLLETEIRLLKQQGNQPDPRSYEEQFGSLLGDRVKDLFSRVRDSLPAIPGYEILDTIGHGGMGVVYRAKHLLLNREVALKLIRPEKMRDEATTASFKARFRREAESVASINHPNVVQIYETGDYDGTLFLAMELVKGQSLQKYIDTHGVMSPQNAAAMFIKLAQGLQAVHEKQIIHRDLKPDNILLSEQLEPKISDFGLARPLESASHETAAGTPVGTPAYMSPEQASLKDEKITALVDVYGLGATLYCALTGHAPFPRESLLVTLEKVRTENVLPIRDLRKEVPLDLETICLKCLNKEPKDRYSSSNLLACDLQSFLEDKPIEARPASRLEKLTRWCRRNKMAAGLISVIVTVLIAGAVISSYFAISAESRAQESLKTLDRLAVNEGLRLAESGDIAKALLWFAQPLKETRGLNVEEKQPHMLRYYWHFRYLTGIINLNRSALLKTSYYPTYSRSLISDSNSSAKYKIVRDQDIVFVPHPSISHKHDCDNWHAVSDDGKFITVSLDDNSHALANNTLVVYDAQNGSIISPQLKHDTPVSSALFSPDGRRLVVVTMYYIWIWDIPTGKLVNQPIPFDSLGSRQNIAISYDNRFVAVAKDKYVTIVSISNNKNNAQSFQHITSIYTISFTPDCRLLQINRDDARAIVPLMLLADIKSHNAMFCNPTYSNDKSKLIVVTENEILQWDTHTWKSIGQPIRHKGEFWRANYDTSKDYILAKSRAAVFIYDANTGKSLGLPFIHTSRVDDMQLMCDGKYLLTLANDCIYVWDVRYCFFPHRVLSWQGGIRDISIDNRNPTYVSARSIDSTCIKWDIVTGVMIDRYNDSDSSKLVASSKNGKYCATEREEAGVSVIDVLHEKKVVSSIVLDHRISLHNRGPQDSPRVNFSNDGSMIFILSDSGEARIWHSTNGRPVSAPMRHLAMITSAQFTPDDKYLITTSFDKTARVWDATSGLPLSPPLNHGIAPVGFCELFLNDNRLVTHAMDRHIRLWTLPDNPIQAQDCIKIAELYSGCKLDSLGGVVPLNEGEWRERYEFLISNYPNLFSVPETSLRVWRELQIQECINEGDLASAYFHHWWKLSDAILSSPRKSIVPTTQDVPRTKPMQTAVFPMNAAPVKDTDNP